MVALSRTVRLAAALASLIGLYLDGGETSAAASETRIVRTMVEPFSDLTPVSKAAVPAAVLADFATRFHIEGEHLVPTPGKSCFNAFDFAGLSGWYRVRYRPDTTARLNGTPALERYFFAVTSMREPSVPLAAISDLMRRSEGGSTETSLPAFTLSPARLRFIERRNKELGLPPPTQERKTSPTEAKFLDASTSPFVEPLGPISGQNYGVPYGAEVKSGTTSVSFIGCDFYKF